MTTPPARESTAMSPFHVALEVVHPPKTTRVSAAAPIRAVVSRKPAVDGEVSPHLTGKVEAS